MRIDSKAGRMRPIAVQLYTSMAIIRQAELRVLRHVREGGFGGLWHAGLGHEAIAAGVGAALRRSDRLFQSHRGLGHVVAKGMALEAVFGDILVRRTGSSRGKGAGTPHFADPGVGVMGFSGTLGAGFVLGAGSALAARVLDRDDVTVVVFGDGSSSRGQFHEAALTASTWRLPVVWVCENNQWGLSAAFTRHSPTKTIAERAVAYGMPGHVIDGTDVVAVYEAVSGAVERARAGEGPTLLELTTLRLRGHWEGDYQRYRDDSMLVDDPQHDPMVRARALLDDATAARIDEQAAVRVEAAFDAAMNAPRPTAAVVGEDVWA